MCAVCVDWGNFQIGGTGSAPKARTIRRPPLPHCWAWRTWVVCYSGSRTGQTQNMRSEVMAMEFLFQNHPKSIQKQSESTTENLKFPKIDKGIATRLVSFWCFPWLEVITVIAIPSRELRSQKTQAICQSQWSNPTHKQAFPSRFQWLQLIMVLNPCKVKLGRLTMTCSSGLPSTKTWQKRPKDWLMTPTCNTQRYSFGCTPKT